MGDLHVAFEQLKEKLFKEGLFAPEHKKPLPKYPKRIAIIDQIGNKEFLSFNTICCACFNASAG